VSADIETFRKTVLDASSGFLGMLEPNVVAVSSETSVNYLPIHIE